MNFIVSVGYLEGRVLNTPMVTMGVVSNTLMFLMLYYHDCNICHVTMINAIQRPKKELFPFFKGF